VLTILNNINEDNTDSTTDSIKSADLPHYANEEKELVDVLDRYDDKVKRPVHVRVSVRRGETVEQMLRRFNFAVQEVIQRVKDIQFYEKPSKRKQREEKLRLQNIKRYGS
jgi:ribosomal protein S21